jgi:hypothetical protein
LLATRFFCLWTGKEIKNRGAMQRETGCSAPLFLYFSDQKSMQKNFNSAGNSL